MDSICPLGTEGNWTMVPPLSLISSLDHWPVAVTDSAGDESSVPFGSVIPKPCRNGEDQDDAAIARTNNTKATSPASPCKPKLFFRASVDHGTSLLPSRPSPRLAAVLITRIPCCKLQTVARPASAKHTMENAPQLFVKPY